MTVRIRTPKGQRRKQEPRPHLPVFSRSSPDAITDMTTNLAIKPSPMNKGETEFAELLEGMRERGEILWWAFQAFKLRLGRGAWYTPDFAVLTKGGQLEIWEYKGHWEEAARARIKIAAGLYPFLAFFAVKRKPKKDGGGYHVEDISSHHTLMG